MFFPSTEAAAASAIMGHALEDGLDGASGVDGVDGERHVLRAMALAECVLDGTRNADALADEVVPALGNRTLEERSRES
jgi:hypothetical protein